MAKATEQIVPPNLPGELAADRVEQAEKQLAAEQVEKREKLHVHEGVIRRELIGELETFLAPAAEQLVSSYFLNIDPQRGGTVEGARIAVKDAMKLQRERIDDLDIPRAVRIALRADWEDVMELAPTVIGNRHARGLACFVRSGARKAWALTVPWPIRDQAFFEDQFVAWPLKQVVEQFDRYVVCLSDKEEARLFFVFLERIEELEDVFDEIPGRVRIPDPFRESKYLRKHVEHFHRHFAKVGEAALRLFEREPFEHLIIGGHRETLPQFESYLHRYLRDRIVSRWEIDVRAPTPQVLERALAEEQRVVEHQAEDIWKAIQDARSQRGALGPDEVFAALWLRRMQALLVEPGVARSGVRCMTCGRLQSSGEACVECGNKTAEVPDVFQESVHDAIEQSSQVHYWKHPQLNQAGSISALKRF